LRDRVPHDREGKGLRVHGVSETVSGDSLHQASSLPPAFAEAKLRLRTGRLMGRELRSKSATGEYPGVANQSPPDLLRRSTSPQGGGMSPPTTRNGTPLSLPEPA